MSQALMGVETPPTFLPYHFEVECSGSVYTSNKYALKQLLQPHILHGFYSTRLPSNPSVCSAVIMRKVERV